MAPCLSKFPSVCLEAIFSHVPLYDLFYSVGLVCTSWHKSRRTELLRRRRLGLIQCEEHNHKALNIYRARDCFYGTELIELVRRDDGSPWHTLESLEKYKFNCLSVPGGVLAVPFIASLNTNFTKITRLHLNITLSTSHLLTQLIRLIEHYSQHLVELKFAGGFYPETDDDDDDDDEEEDATCELALNITNFFDCINRLQSLRHLKLRVFHLGSRPPPLSCLTRLVTFAVYVPGHDLIDNWIFPSIMQYAQNETSIEINNSVTMGAMLQFDAQLAAKFNVLSLDYTVVDDFAAADEDYDRMQALSLFCTRFSSLTKLKLESITDPMTKLARCLSLLTQLVHLDLHFYCITEFEAVQPVEGEGEDEEQGQVEQAQREITQVPSVRLLIIYLFTESHRDSESLFIAEIFPNLQVLRLGHGFFECLDCGIGPMTDDSDDSDGSDDSDDFVGSGDSDGSDDSQEDGFDRVDKAEPVRARRVAECKRLARQPFRRCANLHTVALENVSGEETLISLDDL